MPVPEFASASASPLPEITVTELERKADDYAQRVLAINEAEGELGIGPSYYYRTKDEALEAQKGAFRTYALSRFVLSP